MASSQRLALAVGLYIFLLPTAPARAANGYVRVNQLGYESGRLMRAYLMTLGPDDGASYSVQNSDGMVVYSAAVGSRVGLWGGFSVYALDFRLRKNDLYTIAVTGPIGAVSPSFPVDSALALYSAPLANALYFYQNERDGADFIPTPLRTAPAHLNDEVAAVYFTPEIDRNDNLVGDLHPTGAIVDASGGWWDAGDYLKFVQTESYTTALMLIGVRDFPRQMGARAPDADFSAEAKFGADWLKRMWDDASRTLYYQVGIGTGNDETTSDHDIWRLPQVDDTYGGSVPAYRYIRNRPVLLAAPAGSLISPNLAGRLAAAFAESYQLFRESDPAFAHACLFSAEHIFDLADTAIRGELLTTAPFDFYPETEWRDDLELGATELYLALATTRRELPRGLPHRDPLFYLQAAANWARAYIQGPNDAADTLNLYDVSGLAHFELHRAISFAGHPGGLAVSQSDLLDDLERQLGVGEARAALDPFGYGFPWDEYDSATHGAGLSVMAKEVVYLTGDASYENDSRLWLGNILGANAWGSSFIVADGSTFPDCMQHQVANLVGSLDGTEPLLRGALVEGPNSFAAKGFLAGMRRCPPGSGNLFAQFNGNGAVYKDNVQSYSTVEPSIDLTAASFLMFAWRTAGRPEPLGGF
jgi:endoglucanase